MSISPFRIEPLESRLLLHGSLVFDEEFNQAAGTMPSQSTWKYDTGSENGAYYIDDSTTLQIVSDATASDGKALMMTVYPDPNNAGSYLGARINTSNSPIGGQIEYGHVEARVRMPGGPNGAGDGIGCSFWMLGSNFPTVGWPQSGETDIMENSGESPAQNGGTIHGPGFQQPGIYANYDLPAGQYFYQSYHTFAVDWSPGVVQFSVDGHVYAIRTRADLSSTQTWVFDHPFFIILGIGRDGGSVDANTVLPQHMYVDYVRAYAEGPVGTPSQLSASAVSQNQINLSWRDTTFDDTGYTLQRSRSESFSTIDASYSVAFNVDSTIDTGLSAGTTYFYRIQADSSDGTTTNTSAWSYLTSATTWTDQDIATTGGSATFANDVMTENGAGITGIGGTSDAFNFSGQTTTGDGTWIAEVTSITNTNSSAGAGVMVRNSSDPASAFAAVFITPSSKAVFDYRTAAGGTASSTSSSVSALPVWVELVRSGNSFSAYTSANGSSWTRVGSTQTVGLLATTLGGAVVTSHSATVCTANFSNLTFSSAAVAPTLAINSGGTAAGPFIADANYSGGSTSTSSNAIDTVGSINPGPTAVYQSNRYGTFSYTAGGLVAGQMYDVQLLFAETYWPSAGQRIFDVIVNGDMALPHFDMIAESGAADRATTLDILTPANSSGQIALQFNTIKDNAQVNGIRILPEAGWINATASQVISSSTSVPGLTISDGVTVTANATVSVNTLNLLGTAKYDLTDSALIIHGGNLTTVTSEIQGASSGGGGILSSTAAGDSTHLTAVGVMANSNGVGGATNSVFGGQSVSANDILVRYTYFGDANLDGKVDGSDYTRIDNGYLTSLTGWGNGDFNYDGTINGSDYTLIDNAFNRQGAAFSASPAMPATFASPAAFADSELWIDRPDKAKPPGIEPVIQSFSELAQ